ncbi:MAG: glycosyltransferase [Bacteroidaceae bacterium]|nr:glycosyltransferase [Bacteroidaceae bacterium]
MSKPQVSVLLSTYNGELYLQQQLDSIYAQKGVNVNLLVRDDGSTDKTCDILQKEALAKKLTWYTGENLKPAWSFWHLLVSSPQSAYYSFSDQDDFWLEDKLFTAVSHLKDFEAEPALYFSQTQLADAQLHALPNVTLTPLLTYGEALIYQFVGGCTMVINDKMREILLRYTPNYMQMHDFWIYDVALAVGAHVVFDSTPHMLYRQHGHNAVGQLNQKQFVWKSRINRLLKHENIRLRTTQELWNGYKDLMPVENQILTQRILSYPKSCLNKMKLMFDKRLTCSKRSVTWSTKLSFLLHLF